MAVGTLLIYGLAVWRISSLIANEAGPFDIFERFRFLVGVRYDERSERYATNRFADGVMCVWCVSVWVGIAWAIAWNLWQWESFVVAFPFAISAVAAIVECAVNGLKP